MQVQLDKAQPIQGGTEIDSDCLCPPVCFQCPPPFCLPCGPGPGGASPDLAEECLPAPKQCGPFILLNTPMDRKCIMLPMIQQERPAERHGRRGHNGHNGRDHRNDVDCCDQSHHHHHDDECCDKSHHHHHHRDDDEYEKCERHEKHDAHRDRNHNNHERDKDRERDSSRSRKSKNSTNGESNGKSKRKSMDESEPRGRDRKRSHAKTPRTQSRELRGGKLYIGCDCNKRNGLQDDCQRSLCQGAPECITIPPTCAPSAYSNGRHLQKQRDEAEKKLRERFKLC